MGCLSAIIFGILQLAAVVFVAVGTPLAMFQPRGDDITRNGYCITMWGIRERCFIPRYSARPHDIWMACGNRAQYFKVAQVFSIAAIILLLVSMLASSLDSCCCYCAKIVCIVLNLAAACLLGLVWGLMLDSYQHNQGSHTVEQVDVCQRLRDFPGVDGSFPQGMQLGAGFILLVCAMAISVVNAFSILIPC